MKANVEPSNLSPISKEMLLQRLSAALSARQVMLSPDHTQALRLFNGFYEGCPGLVVDLYGSTLVVAIHARPPESVENFLAMVFDFYGQALFLANKRVAKAPACRRPRTDAVAVISLVNR
jgi:23S rRNA G2069 N7-methylase RlmK/C1962 C5-methylase RlmI